MALMLAAALALAILLAVLRLSSRLTVRLRVFGGMTLARQAPAACPHLGLIGDPFAHQDQPADDHRCYLWMQRDRIDLLHQKSFCFTVAHHQCPWLMIRRPGVQPSRRHVPGFAGAFVRQSVAALATGAGSIPHLAMCAARSARRTALAAQRVARRTAVVAHRVARRTALAGHR
ncbi:MAG: hypothetical protein ACYDAG_15300, partial [Chloroflexota bacterium]